MCSSYKHTCFEREKKYLGQWWKGKAPVRVKHREREQHMCSGEGEETSGTQRQRQQRAEKCGFYLTPFVILPCHAKEIFACVCERGRDNKQEVAAIVGHQERERGRNRQKEGVRRGQHYKH